jgi:gliding motility-associated-like protein
MAKFFYLLLFVFCSKVHLCHAQAIGFVEGNATTIFCDSSCATVHTSYTKLYKTTNYNVDTIPFTTQTLAGATVLNLSDDSFSNIIPIGFTFCFYNNTYTNLVVSRNGVVSFDLNFANIPCSFNTAQTIPFSSNSFPTPSIFCPFMDLTATTTGNIRYKTIGVAPYRKFVLQYNNLPLFGANCINAKNTSELVLHEIFNYVDVNVTKKSVCNNNLLDTINYATIGIQGNNTATTAPGKHANVWTATNQSWRFTPAGAPNYTLSYIPSQAYTTMYANPDSIRICTINYPATIVAKYVLQCPAITITDTIIINYYKPVIDSITLTSNVCAYDTIGTIHIYSSAPATPLQYVLNNMAPQSSPIFTNLSNGLYTVVVIDTNNCKFNNITAIGSQSKLNIKVDSFKASDCATSNGALYLSADYGQLPYTWLWTTGNTTSSLLNIVGDSTFGVKVTDNLGCVDSAKYSTFKKGPDIIDSVINSTCPDSNGKIYIKIGDSSGVPPFTYLWNTGATTSFITGCAPNTYYSVKVTDSLGCFKIANILMGQDSLPVVKLNIISKPTCNKMNGVITATIQGGIAPYSYLWNNLSTNAINTTADSGLIILTITDAVGCKSGTFLYWKDTLDMKINTNSGNTFCGLQNGIAGISAFNGMAPYTYLWNTGSGAPVITGLAAGLYQVTVTDALACVKTGFFTISPSVPMTISLFPKNMNCDTTNGLINTTVANSNNPIAYNWSNGGTTANITGLNMGLYNVVATDAKGCISSATATIIDDGSPSAGFSNYQAPLCAGDSTGKITLVGLNGTAPYKYSLDGINYVTSPTILNISSGTYTMYVKDANSCVTDTVVSLKDGPKINIQYNAIDTLVCFNDVISKIVFNTSGGYKPYALAVDNGLYGSTLIASNLSIGTHTVAIKDSIGCIIYLDIKVNGPDSALKVIAQTKDLLCFEKLNGAARATIEGGWPPYLYSWDNGSTALLQDSLVAGKYIFTVQDAKGCKVVQPYLVKKQLCCNVLLPTGFSPSSASIANQTFKVLVPEELTEIQFDIYTRWGQKIFSSTNAMQGWDGTANGKAMPMETYFYKIKYKCVAEENYLYKNGEVVLVR